MTHTNEEYVKQLHTSVREVAKDILGQSTTLIEGSIKLASLNNEIFEGAIDEDFRIFIAIASDTDHLPTIKTRQHYSDRGLAKTDIEIKEIENHYREDANAACSKLIDRFSSAT